MKKRLMHIFLTLGICAVFVLISSSVIASAAPNNDNQKTFSLNSDIVFRGDFSSHEIYFNVSKWWDVNGAELQVNYTRSQISTQNAQTFFVFYINNIPFRSQEIFYKGNDEVQTLKINVPKRLLKSGNNTLKIEAYMRISDLPCVDDVNPANWATINKGTGITVSFNNKLANDNIGNFPYPYLKENNNPQVNTQIVVPNNYKDYDISNALMMQSYLSRLFTTGDYNGTIVKENDINKDNNIIYIGSYNDLPAELKKSVGSVNGIDFNKEALIQQVNSPYSNNQNIKALMILSDNQDMISKAVRLMMNYSLVMQLDSPRYVVNDNVKELQEIQGDKDTLTMQDLGSDGIYLQGPFTRSVNLGYKMPKNKVLASGGKIHLNMRYSQNLDFNKALVTVYINNVPVGSKKLSYDKANGDTLELTIPRDIPNSAYLNIEISFDLAMTNTWCEKRQEKTPWAYVTPDSYIYLPSVQSKDYNFQRYPNPYVENYAFNNVLVVTPDNMNSTDLTKLGNMFALMGTGTKYNTGNITVESGNSVGDLVNDSNLIVYGTPNNNPFIKKINNDLWFKYNSNYTGFESNAKQYLTTPFNENITTFQMCKSPFNSQRGMLVITSPKDKNLQDATLYLSDSKKILDLTGDSAIVDQYGNLQNFQMIKPENNAPSFDMFKQSNLLTKGLMGLLVLIIVLVGVSIFLYLNKYKKENKNDSDDIPYRKRFKRR